MSVAQKYGSLAIGLLSIFLIGMIIVGLSGLAAADPVSGSTSVAAPANGTADFLNITFQAQQYVGFYGNVSTVVMKSGGDVGKSMLNHTMRNGTVFITKAGNIFSGTLTPAPTDPWTNGNLSLTGEYLTGNWFTKNGTEGCGVGFDSSYGMPQLNTTDNFTVSLLQNDTTGSPLFLTCSHINITVSANGFGVENYQLIAPKTSLWTAYDLYVEGGYT